MDAGSRRVKGCLGHRLGCSDGREAVHAARSSPRRVGRGVQFEGTFLSTGGEDRQVRIWDLATGKQKSLLRAGAREGVQRPGPAADSYARIATAASCSGRDSRRAAGHLTATSGAVTSVAWPTRRTPSQRRGGWHRPTVGLDERAGSSPPRTRHSDSDGLSQRRRSIPAERRCRRSAPLVGHQVQQAGDTLCGAHRFGELCGHEPRRTAP